MKFAESVGLTQSPGQTQPTNDPNQNSPLATGNASVISGSIVGGNCTPPSNIESCLTGMTPLITSAGVGILTNYGVFESGLFEGSSNLCPLTTYFSGKSLTDLQIIDYLVEILDTGIVIDYTGSCDATIYSVDSYLTSLNPIGCPTPTPTPTVTSTQTQTPTQTPTKTPTMTQTPTSTSLSSVCFTLYSGITFEQINIIPTGVEGGKPYYVIPSTLTVIWWDSVNLIWKHSSTLGGGTIYDTLTNPGQYPVTINPTYVWNNVATAPKNVSDSNLGSCFALPSNTPTMTQTQTPTTTKTQTPTPTITRTPAMTPTPTQTNTPTNASPGACSSCNCTTATISSVSTTFAGQYNLIFSVGGTCASSCLQGVVLYYKKSYQSTYSSTFVTIGSFGPPTVNITSAINSLPKDYFPIDLIIQANCGLGGTTSQSPVFQFEPCVNYTAVGGGVQIISGRLCSSSTSSTYTVGAGNCVCMKGFVNYSPGTFTPNTIQYCRTGSCTPGCISCQS